MCELVCVSFWFGLSLEVAPFKFFPWLRPWSLPTLNNLEKLEVVALICQLLIWTLQPFV
jgi:hypothetical protein